MSKTGNSAFVSWLSTGSGSGGGSGTLNFISVTKAQLDTLVGGSTLVPGSFYKITDRGDLGILVQATSANTISINGIRYMLCPANYTPGAVVGAKTSLGVWNSSITPVAGNTAIWGGLVWLNNTGAVGNFTNQAALAGPDWTVIPKASFADGEYTPMQFGVIYDYANDFISQQWDKKGNVFGISYQEFTDGAVSLVITGNPCDMSDWNLSTMTSTITNFALFFNNKCKGVFNNSVRDAVQTLYLFNNTTNGFIYNNTGTGGLLDISLNLIDGNIYNNTLSGFCEIRLNGSNVFAIFGNSASQINSNNNPGNINDNVVAGGFGFISYNNNAGHIGNSNPNGNITFNSNNGQLNSNNVAGDVRGNSNNGEIINNANQGAIIQNSNNGVINGNTNQDAISANSNEGSILNNANAGVISNNSNNGSISANTSNVVLISFNGCAGDISGNDNAGDISYNRNGGSISDNAVTITTILSNINNGSISTNGGDPTPVTIQFNTNNGLISNPAWAADVTDPVVDKT